VKLYLNGEEVQAVNPFENVLTPSQIHRHVFSTPELSEGKDWVLIGTGTPAGTIFYAPTTLQRVWLFMRSGFSMERAQERWLARFDFLQKGDVLEFRSEVLGHISTTLR
jgi:2-keto-4-pentenoate hydratase/2-oxohepta-3-ene-1,7-dioic acid hydratase in catechol pathway